MKKISVINLSKNKVDECNNFALNLSTAISQKNKKVLLVATDFFPSYINNFNINSNTISKAKVIPPFVLYKVNNNIHLLLLILPELKVQIKSTADLANAMIKQIRVFKDEYDYLVVCLNDKWADLDNCFIQTKDDTTVYYFNASDVNTNAFTNLKLASSSFFVLDQYVGDDKTHMQAYTSLTKMLRKFELLVLSENNQTFYQLKEPKSPNSLKLLEFAKKLY